MLLFFLTIMKKYYLCQLEMKIVLQKSVFRLNLRWENVITHFNIYKNSEDILLSYIISNSIVILAKISVEIEMINWTRGIDGQFQFAWFRQIHISHQ